MYIHLFSAEEEQKTMVKIVNDNGLGWKKFQVLQKFVEPDHLICKAKYRELPKNLLKDNLSQSYDFLIPFALRSEEIAFSQIQTMTFIMP